MRWRSSVVHCSGKMLRMYCLKNYCIIPFYVKKCMFICVYIYVHTYTYLYIHTCIKKQLILEGSTHNCECNVIGELISFPLISDIYISLSGGILGDFYLFFCSIENK